MTSKLKKLLGRTESWPPEAQEELAQVVQDIELELGGGAYQATAEELAAIDEADRSGVASEVDVGLAFAKFRRHEG